VQGAGSFVTYQAITWGEKFRTWSKADLLKQIVAFEKWQDAEGVDLPLPHDEEAIARFTDWEVDYLCTGILNGVWGEQGKADQKNSD
jgi:hypothetical protein